RRHGVREHGRVLIEVDREQLGPRPEGLSSSRSRAAGVEDLSYHVCELPTGCPDPAQVPLVLGWRHESEIVGKGRRGNQCNGARGHLVPGQAARADRVLVHVGEVLVKVPPDVLREQEANVLSVALEDAVCERSNLEGPERLYSLVGLSEEPEPEQS